MWWRRSDGRLVRDLPNTRRVMPYMMLGRNEAAVYFEQEVGLVKADAFIRSWNQANPMLRIDVFHLAIWAMRDLVERYPSVNRFVAGGRLYDRKGIWFSYAVKQRLEVGSPLVVVKRRFDTDASFAEMVNSMATGQRDATSSDNTVDRELGLLMKFPGFVRRIIMRSIRVGDRLGMLPRGFIEKDPMYATTFFANMASLGMPAVYHHLYEYGTCPIFGSLGRPVAEPGSPTSGPDRRRTMTVKWTFDERTEDGLTGWYSLRRFKQVLEDPEAAGLAVVALPAGTAGVGDASATDQPVDSEAAPVDS
jgi:hypothetical protein